MTNATNVETKHLKVGDVSYAYRELRPAKLVDPTPVVFLQRFRGTLDDWDPAFVDELAKHWQDIGRCDRWRGADVLRSSQGRTT